MPIALRQILGFVVANLFLLGMLLAGAASAVALTRLAQLLGAGDDELRWLYLPIGVAAVAACYYAGKVGHRLLSKAI